MPADLHVHTTSSDAKMSGPRQVELAAAAGLNALAITDHNAISAVPGAQFVAGRWGVEVIAGQDQRPAIVVSTAQRPAKTGAV